MTNVQKRRRDSDALDPVVFMISFTFLRYKFMCFLAFVLIKKLKSARRNCHPD